jgi:hypothetical protein
MPNDSAPISHPVIERYLSDKPGPRLVGVGMPATATAAVLADVRARLVSLLRRWRDPADRSAALLPGEEEATFWEPASAPLVVRQLIVLAVRNSRIET